MLDLQGVVTLIMPVEPFTTESKCNQRINTSFSTKSSDQGTFQRGDQAAYRRPGKVKPGTKYIYKVSC